MNSLRMRKFLLLAGTHLFTAAVGFAAGVVAAVPLRRSTSSTSESTSASMTVMSDLVRSWLRSSRAVSVFGSMLSEPPLRKPATSTRRKGVTSIFA